MRRLVRAALGIGVSALAVGACEASPATHPVVTAPSAVPVPVPVPIPVSSPSVENPQPAGGAVDLAPWDLALPSDLQISVAPNGRVLEAKPRSGAALALRVELHDDEQIASSPATALWDLNHAHAADGATAVDEITWLGHEAYALTYGRGKVRLLVIGMADGRCSYELQAELARDEDVETASARLAEVIRTPSGNPARARRCHP